MMRDVFACCATMPRSTSSFRLFFCTYKSRPHGDLKTNRPANDGSSGAEDLTRIRYASASLSGNNNFGWPFKRTRDCVGVRRHAKSDPQQTGDDGDAQCPRRADAIAFISTAVTRIMFDSTAGDIGAMSARGSIDLVIVDELRPMIVTTPQEAVKIISQRKGR